MGEEITRVYMVNFFKKLNNLIEFYNNTVNFSFNNKTKEELFEENIEYVPYEELEEMTTTSSHMKFSYEEPAFDSESYFEEVNDECVVYEPETNGDVTPTKQTILANVIEMYQCMLCQFVTPSDIEFVQHHKSHTTNRVLRPTLLTTFLPPPSTPPQQQHLTPERTNHEMFLCGQCREVFISMDLCRDHMIEDHKFQDANHHSRQNQEEDPWSRDDDAITDTDDEADQNRDDYHHDQWLKPIPLRELKSRLLKKFIYKCSLKGCKYKFETEDKCDRHIECHDSTDFQQVRDFKCTECGSEFRKWRDATKHMWKSHQIDIDLLKCPLCEYKALTSILIFRHLQIHSLVKGFACPECTQVFRQAAQLRHHSISHMDTDAKNSGRKRWYSEKTCDICTHKFSNSKTLSKHIKVVHNKIKPFICSVCGYKAARKASMTIHMRQHSGQKPYKCKTCEFTARDPSGLRKHEILHSTVNPHKCRFCDYSTAQAAALKKHVQVGHTEEYKRTMCCDECRFMSINEETLRQHKADHRSGVIQNEDDSSGTVENSPKNLLKRPRSAPDKPNSSVEVGIFSHCINICDYYYLFYRFHLIRFFIQKVRIHHRWILAV